MQKRVGLNMQLEEVLMFQHATSHDFNQCDNATSDGWES